jgi:hypothetical protein
MLAMSAAGAFAQSILAQYPSASPSTVRRQETHSHASDAHKCCHSSSAPRLEIAGPLPLANMPCGSQHSCCVRPGPASFAVVTLPFGRHRLRHIRTKPDLRARSAASTLVISYLAVCSAPSFGPEFLTKHLQGCQSVRSRTPKWHPGIFHPTKHILSMETNFMKPKLIP